MKNATSQSAPAHVQQIQAELIRRKDVERITALSRSGIYSRLDEKSPQYDPTFPTPITLGVMSVAWVLPEIYFWVESIIAKSRAESQLKATEASGRKAKIANRRESRMRIADNRKAAGVTK